MLTVEGGTRVEGEDWKQEEEPVSGREVVSQLETETQRKLREQYIAACLEHSILAVHIAGTYLNKAPSKELAVSDFEIAHLPIQGTEGLTRIDLVIGKIFVDQGKALKRKHEGNKPIADSDLEGAASVSVEAPDTHIPLLTDLCRRDDRFLVATYGDILGEMKAGGLTKDLLDRIVREE